MKYIDIIARINTMNYIPAVGLEDEARATIALNVVSYEEAIVAFEEEMRKTSEKLKGKGFDDKLNKFRMAITPPKEPTEEQASQIEKLRADPGFEAFRKEFQKWEQRSKAARKKAEEERDIEVHEYPIKEHLAAISRVMPAGSTVMLRKGDGSGYDELDYQTVFTWVVEIASKQKKQ